jgi:hypothetical protein
LNAVAEFSEVLTLDQAERPVDFGSSRVVDGVSSTQQLLDELLGRFEDDSAMFLAHNLSPELLADVDE